MRKRNKTATLRAVQGERGVGGVGRRQDAGRTGPASWRHPNQIIDWKRPISERAADVFGKSGAFDQPVDSKSTRAKIGRLTLKKDFLK